MSLANMKDVLDPAARDKFGVGAFNILDYGSMKAIVNGAEELSAPVIVQTSVKTVKYWGMKAIVEWYRELAGGSKVPVVLHLDHCKDPDFVLRCADAGWTSVMIDASSFPFEENMAMTKRVIEYAHPKGISVEAELGEIGGVEEDIVVDMQAAHYADPDKAKEFLAQLKVDVFAPNIGTAHGLYKGEPKIRYELIERIADENGIPLALHGGSGLTDETFRKCISLGCAKVNISTNLKYAFIEGFENYRKDHPSEYEPILIMAAQVEAQKDVVTRHIRLFGSEGKA